MKILLITYAFPPCAAIGSKRWGEFYKLSLQDNDIEFEVLTANWKGDKSSDKNIHYIGKELEYKPPKSLNKKIKYTDIIKHPSLAIRSLDSSIFLDWYKASREWIKNNQSNSYDFIVSSYSPITSVLLGNYAKSLYNIPHILDLRDLMSIQGQKLNIFPLDMLDKGVDKFLTRNIDKFLTVSPTCCMKAKAFYKKNVFIIHNGLSRPIEDKFVNLSIENKSNLNILYMGTLGLSRNPKHILSIFNAFAKNNNISIEVNFASQDNPFDFIDSKVINHISINWLGYLSANDLAKEKLKANSFLLLEDLSSKGNENLTGKIFEYIYDKKPIFISCNRKSDIVHLMKEINAGSLIEKESDLKIFINQERYLNVEKTNFYTRYNQYKLLKKLLVK